MSWSIQTAVTTSVVYKKQINFSQFWRLEVQGRGEGSQRIRHDLATKQEVLGVYEHKASLSR